MPDWEGVLDIAICYKPRPHFSTQDWIAQWSELL
jgi:hypothetical protein